jgi:1-deoxy-D-xylulose-5-phosphate reductoisomerase
MTSVTILGSTGSIGASTLDVIRRHRERYRVHALVAGRNLARLAEQVREFQPAVAVIADEADLSSLFRKLREILPPGARLPELAAGRAAYVAAATGEEVGFVMSAMVGIAGLEATYQAAVRGKRIGLANKETLVAGGSVVMEAVKRHGTELIPVDSEHNGAHQCLRAGRRHEVSRLILTASGGPFRLVPKSALADVTPEDALNHPTWKMGPRITIDSATMLNKGFEVIEACWLFDFQPRDVEVVVHPQSTVHALVEYNDGSVIAQVCATDMRMPIQYALTWPERAPAPVPRLDWSQSRTWEFHPPDLDKFPLLRLAYEAQAAGGSAACTLNAADEVAVEAFLNGEIPFPAIPEIAGETLARVPSRKLATVDEILEMDRGSRSVAREVVRERVAAGARPVI